MKANKYLDFFLNPFESAQSRKVLRVNPTTVPVRSEAEVLSIQIHSFGGDDYEMVQTQTIEDCFEYPKKEKKCWINIDGINKVELEKCLVPLKIHTLILEDIINIGQRPKIEEIDGLIFCVLNMLYFNEKKGEVETEKMSVILGNKMLITIQEDDLKDAFNTVRERLNVKTSRVRQYDIDFLLYALIDAIVDHYFVVMNKLADHILLLEMEIIKDSSKRTLIKINHLRNAIVLMKRSIGPVPELIQGIIKTESDWINERSEKYFRDVYDHARQANELLENHRDMMVNLHDLYMSNMNVRLNESMKIMTIVTCLLAPATVIGGIFGMNLDFGNWVKDNLGFWGVVGIMFLTFGSMLYYFRRKRWF